MNANLKTPIAGRHLGFTLVEIIISLALLSLIFLMLFSSLYSTNRHWQSGLRSADNNTELRLATQFIKSRLSQAAPLVWFDKKGRQILFKGETESLGFSTTLPAHRGGGGYYFVTLKLLESGTGLNLGMEYELIGPDLSPLEVSPGDRPEQVSLVDDVRKLTFSYYGKESPEQYRFR